MATQFDITGTKGQVIASFKVKTTKNMIDKVLIRDVSNFESKLTTRKLNKISDYLLNIYKSWNITTSEEKKHYLDNVVRACSAFETLEQLHVSILKYNYKPTISTYRGDKLRASKLILMLIMEENKYNYHTSQRDLNLIKKAI